MTIRTAAPKSCHRGRPAPRKTIPIGTSTRLPSAASMTACMASGKFSTFRGRPRRGAPQGLTVRRHLGSSKLRGRQGLDEIGVVIFRRVYPRTDRRRDETLLERSESFVRRALEPRVAILARQRRRHTLLGRSRRLHWSPCSIGQDHRTERQVAQLRGAARSYIAASAFCSQPPPSGRGLSRGGFSVGYNCCNRSAVHIAICL